jgi:hypothetical protein
VDGKFLDKIELFCANKKKAPLGLFYFGPSFNFS